MWCITSSVILPDRHDACVFIRGKINASNRRNGVVRRTIARFTRNYCRQTPSRRVNNLRYFTLVRQFSILCVLLFYHPPGRDKYQLRAISGEWLSRNRLIDFVGGNAGTCVGGEINAWLYQRRGSWTLNNTRANSSSARRRRRSPWGTP